MATMDDQEDNNVTELQSLSSNPDVSQDVSMETNMSKMSEPGGNRKEIEINMGVSSNANEDPLDRCDPCLRCCRAMSPVQALLYMRLTLEHHYQRYRTWIWRVILGTIVVIYFFYLGAAFRHRFGDEPSLRLFVVTLLVILGLIYHYVKKHYGEQIYNTCVRPIVKETARYHRFIKFVLTVVLVTAIVLFILIDTSLRRPASLVSVLGIIVFVTFMFFFSTDPRQVTWRPVLWGLLLQLIFALIVLRTRWGYEAFDWLGDRVTDYLGYTAAGSKFVFGDDFMDHSFAFLVMPVLIFFSATIGILYYLGVIQMLIEKIAFIMQISLGTGAMESLHAAFNIFVGWAETITLVRPLLDKMTISELHTVMTNGFATAAGSTLGIYILMGAPANHLLSASVMSAPAALAMSKLFYPESKENRKKSKEHVDVPMLGSGVIDAASIRAVGAISIVANVVAFLLLLNVYYRLGSGIIDAASIGAVGAISIVAHVLASVIAFISLLEFVNVTLQWFGERVGLTPPDYPALSFELICSYLFWPVAFLMGVEPSDCRIVARMAGVKTLVNEFIAYEDLGKVKANRALYEEYLSSGRGGTWTVDGASNWVLTDYNSSVPWVVQGLGGPRVFNDTNIVLKGGVISPHSEMIATYALCGFSNVVALGIMIGALSAVAPSRKKDILSVSVRALISGCMACFMTACIAGLLGDG